MVLQPFGGVLIGGPQSGAPQQILQNQQENHLNITNYRGVHGGSLPNVNQMAQGEKVITINANDLLRIHDRVFDFG